jgi:calcineurin-like phosphoesterase family protein
MIYYIADTHFGNANMLRLWNRPFSSIEEHDGFLIKSWNETVNYKDDIYIIGDAFCSKKINVESYLNCLNGRKHLIIGNHDSYYLNKNMDKHFESITQIAMIYDEGKCIVLCHYPMAEWSNYYNGAYHVHGHIHNNRVGDAFRFLRMQDRVLNAGVDINNFRPVTFEELIINNNEFKALI